MASRPVKQSIDALLAELKAQASARPREGALCYSPVGQFYHGDAQYCLERFIFPGPGSNDVPTRIGVFAAIHGDEPEGARALVEFLKRLDREPERAHGYQIYAYPVCNPTGYEDCTRHSRAGLDLNREFWRDSNQPEVRVLERELVIQRFNGVISLHSDDTVDGLYAFVRGATLTEALARPALDAAARFLPRAQGDVIDSFPALDALIHHCYGGVLSNPAELHPAPFEIIFETPQKRPFDLQVEAGVAALDRIIAEYRSFLAIQADL